jgi:hypothetical protein
MDGMKLERLNSPLEGAAAGSVAVGAFIGFPSQGRALPYFE